VTLSCNMTYRRYAEDYHKNPRSGFSASISWESAAGTFLSRSSTNITINPWRDDEVVTVGETLTVDVVTLASGTEIPSYNCTTEFQFTDTEIKMWTFAVNDVSWTCTSPPVYTWYCPSSVTFEPSSEPFTAGKLLKCTSDGYPKPSYTDQDGKVVSTAQTTSLYGGPFSLTCTATGNLTTPCSAPNSISGKTSRCVLDLNFVVDSSGSINHKSPNNWNTTLQFLANVSSSFIIGPNDVQVAFVLFSTRATVEWGLTRYRNKTSLIQAILSMRYLYAKTNLNDALYLTRTEVFAPGRGTRPGACKLTVILTDGEDNVPVAGTLFTIQNATKCKNQGIRLIAVGVTDKIDKQRLLQIVSSPDDIYTVDDFPDLSSITDQLASKLYDSSLPTGPQKAAARSSGAERPHPVNIALLTILSIFYLLIQSLLHDSH